MCGQVGLIFGAATDAQGNPPWFSELEYLKKVFTEVLVANEARGKDATGLGWMNSAGANSIIKTTDEATEFVEQSDYFDFLKRLGPCTAALIGHTRWPTKKNAPVLDVDNQPLAVESIWGTHNGTIYNADELFHEWKLPRSAKVDSEIIFQLANAHVHDGILNVPTFLEAMLPFQGQYSGSLFNQKQPNLAWVIRGNKPLTVMMQPEWQVVLFTSLDSHLEPYDLENGGWVAIDEEPMSMIEFDRVDITQYTAHSFEIQRQTHEWDPP